MVRSPGCVRRSVRGLMQRVLELSYRLGNWAQRNSYSEQSQVTSSAKHKAKVSLGKSGGSDFSRRSHVYSGWSTCKLQRGSAKTGHPKTEKRPPLRVARSLGRKRPRRAATLRHQSPCCTAKDSSCLN